MANISHSSSSQDPLGRSSALVSIEVFIAIVICLVSTLDNLLVVYVINRDHRFKSITNIFIHNLALTDITMATLHMPFWVVSLYTGTWIFSNKLCEIAASMQFTLGIASILNMGLIAMNRYIKVVRPNLSSKLFSSKRLARLYCALVWIGSALLSTPPLYGWGNMAYHNKFAVCSLNWDVKYISYVILIVGVVVNGTTSVIFYSYYKIYKVLKTSSQNLNAHGPEEGVHHSNSRRTDIKLLKTSFTVVCVFVMTWGPVSIVVLVETAGCVIPREVHAVVVYLMFTSSLVNPIIYGIMNPQFRLAFKRVLCCGRHGNAENASQPNTGTDGAVHSILPLNVEDVGCETSRTQAV